MSRYTSFISYRKSHDTCADLVKKTLVEEYGYSDNEIFLDKHDIGPEEFDKKIKSAVESASSLILIVTKDCFVPKENDEDWFLMEIKTAINNGVTIIPLLFDDIKSLGSDEIRSQLKAAFTEDEINKLVKSQAIRYDFDLSDATFSKLSDFIQKTKKTTLFDKIVTTIKVLGAVIVVFAIVFALFLGIGVLWGYLTSGTSNEDILIDNTAVDGYTMSFDFGGLKATYDLQADTVYVNFAEAPEALPKSNYEILAQSCSVSGAVLLFDKNVSNFKYFKWAKYVKGSKPGKIVMLCVTIGAGVGSFCGFSQGSSWGRALKQNESAIELYSRLKERSSWLPVVNRNKNLQRQYNIAKLNRSKDIYVYVYPSAANTIANNQGLLQKSILLKYNNWEIGENTLPQLKTEVDKSLATSKDVVILELGTDTIKYLSLPSGIVGIGFEYPIAESDISQTIYRYTFWRNQ